MDAIVGVDSDARCAECGVDGATAPGPHGLPLCEECREVQEELEASEQAEGD